MVDRAYPYKGWVLLPSFKPIEVEFVSRYRSFGNEDYGDNSASGKLYRRNEIHATKADAIAFGRSEVTRMHADLEKRSVTLWKKRSALDKAEGSQP